MGNYKNAFVLAIECEEMANKIKAGREAEEQQKNKYNDLINRKLEVEQIVRRYRNFAIEAEKNVAQRSSRDNLYILSVTELWRLVELFEEMGNYKDAPALAIGCDEVWSKITAEQEAREEQEAPEKYMDLVNRKAQAKSEYEFRLLASQFQKMGNYKDALVLSKECEEVFEEMKSLRYERCNGEENLEHW